MADIKQTLDERGARYGEFAKHAVCTQELKAVIAAYQRRPFTPSMQEALDMICHKIGRIANGDPTYADSWVDIAGYAQLVVNELEGGQ
ncbi:MAG: DUF6378 domain-containing protein [Cetobacterium sp.]